MMNMSLFKILKTRNKTVVDNCLYYLNMLPVSYALDLGTFKFLCKESTSTNPVNRVLYDINSSRLHCVLNRPSRRVNQQNLPLWSLWTISEK